MENKQVWEIDKKGCLYLLPSIKDKSVDMILTDLPYSLTDCEWDNIISFDELWNEYNRIIKNKGVIALCSTQPFTTKVISSNLKDFRYCWYWLKEKGTGFANANRMPLKSIEEICIFYKELPLYNPVKEPLRHKYIRTATGSELTSKTNKMTSEKMIGVPVTRTHKTPTNVLCYSRETQNGTGIHPTQKPVALFEYLIKTYTNEGDMVHDSCLGSGTTLEACRNTNRNCIGFEISDEWVPHYRKRLKSDNSKLTDTWDGRTMVKVA